jgi:hypothetical protein
VKVSRTAAQSVTVFGLECRFCNGAQTGVVLPDIQGQSGHENDIAIWDRGSHERIEKLNRKSTAAGEHAISTSRIVSRRFGRKAGPVDLLVSRKMDI